MPAKNVELIVWNVGQGQWVTLRTQTACEHFDMGGEKAPWAKIKQSCGSVENHAHFSHWDWDHLSFAQKASTRLAQFCVSDFPNGPGSDKKHEIIEALPKCPQAVSLRSRENLITELTPQFTAGQLASITSNEASRVFELCQGVLIPGDSTTKSERLWVPHLKLIQSPVLVLGHHGSKTSTSEVLLAHLRGALMAISSARKIKYGHPHPLVVARLAAHHIALLRTEEWGTLHFTLSSACFRTSQKRPIKNKRQE